MSEMSTRAPEELAAERLSGVEIYCDSEKPAANSAVVFVCVPKHKVKNAFNSIRHKYYEELKKGNVMER